MKNKIKNILIFSIRGDVHVEQVLKHLSPNTRIFLHNTDVLAEPIENECSISFNQNSVSLLRSDGKRINIEDLTAIWYRKPGLWRPERTVRSMLRRMDYRMKKAEITHVIEGVMEIAQHKGVYCFSDILNIIWAGNKLPQLLVAQQVGLKTPKFIISNQVQSIANFMNQNIKNGVIIKSLTGTVAYANTEMYCMTQQYKLNAFIKKYGKFTTIDHYLTIQEEIHKAFDVRVTVVGQKVFACRILSQENKLSKTDFRTVDPLTLKHEPVQLPFTIIKKLLKLCSYYNLKYAAIDLIEDKMGKYYFLEVNPNGQYLWVEDVAKLPISAAIAEHLENPT